MYTHRVRSLNSDELKTGLYRRPAKSIRGPNDGLVSITTRIAETPTDRNESEHEIKTADIRRTRVDTYKKRKRERAVPID